MKNKRLGQKEVGSLITNSSFILRPTKVGRYT